MNRILISMTFVSESGCEFTVETCVNDVGKDMFIEGDYTVSLSDLSNDCSGASPEESFVAAPIDEGSSSDNPNGPPPGGG